MSRMGVPTTVRVEPDVCFPSPHRHASGHRLTGQWAIPFITWEKPVARLAAAQRLDQRHPFGMNGGCVWLELHHLLLLLGIQPPLTTSLFWRLVKAAVLVGHASVPSQTGWHAETFDLRRLLLLSLLCLAPGSQATDYVQCEAIQRAAARLKAAMDTEALASQNAIILPAMEKAKERCHAEFVNDEVLNCMVRRMAPYEAEGVLARESVVEKYAPRVDRVLDDYEAMSCY